LHPRKAIAGSEKKGGDKSVLLFPVGILLSLWLGAVVLGVWPNAFEPFGPEKELALIIGTFIPLGPAILIIIRKIKTGARLPGPWMMLLYLVVPWTWLLLQQDPVSSPGHLLDSFLFTGLVAAAGLAALLMALNWSRLLLRIWVGLGWLQGALVLLQLGGLDPFYYLTGTAGIWRVYGTLGNPNLVAAFLVPIFFLTQWSELVPDKKWRLPALIGLGMAIIATGSRAGALFFVLGLTVQFAGAFLKRPAGQRLKKALYFLLPLGILAGSFSVGFFMGKGLEGIGGRLVFWRATWELIRDRPWFGHGLGSFRGLYPEGAARLGLEEGAPLALPVQAHNDWIELVLELGIIPGLLLLGIALWAIYKAWVQGYTYLALALGVMVLQAGWDAPLHTAPTALLFFMLLGSIPAAANSYKKQAPRVLKATAVLIIIFSMVALSGTGLFYQRMEAHRTGARARQVVQEEGWLASAPLWQKAWNLAPSEGVFAYWYGQTLALTGDYPRALELMEQAGKTYSDFNLYILQARLENNQGNRAEALAILNCLKTTFPDYRPTYYYLEQLEGE